MGQFFIYLFLEGGMVFLGEGGDCGEFLFFHFFVFNFYQFIVLTLFLIFRNNGKLIKLGVFL